MAFKQFKGAARPYIEFSQIVCHRKFDDLSNRARAARSINVPFGLSISTMWCNALSAQLSSHAKTERHWLWQMFRRFSL